MKTLILAITLCLFAPVFATAQTDNCDKKNIAEVSQYQGVYIFTYAKPVREHQYLGTINVKVCWECKAGEMVNIVLKKLKKEYPTADGIIYTGDNMSQADVIKFKE